MTEMKTQDTAHAFIKCGSNQPYKVKIEHVSSVRYSPRTSPPRIEKFITQSREANTECYSDLDQARLEIKQRQISCFGEAFSFSSDEPEPEKTPLPDPEENSPFA